MFNKKTTNIVKTSTLIIVMLAIATVGIIKFMAAQPAKALDGDITNGITVDSTLDSPDADVGNGICDDGAGHCTLRAAIQEANSAPDASSISFAIAGSGVKTFLPATPLPGITEALTIDGYTQAGASPNTAVSPRPFNGTLLIVIDGSSSTAPSSNGIAIDASNVVVRGLVVHSFNFDGFNVNGNSNIIAGSYIGTDQTGLLDRGNTERGIGNGPGTSTNLVIGGLDPEDRNIISGNDGPGISPNAGHTDWEVLGSYIGLGSDGLTSIANSTYGGSGGLSIDNDDNHTVGGSLAGSTNVISGNNSFGIFPDNTKNLTIQGNIIGPDWKGDPLVTNPQLGGIGMPPLAGPISTVLIGGTSPSQGNLIAYNKGTAVAILSSTNAGLPLYNSSDVAVLGNSIYGNTTEGDFPLSKSALGIDLLNVDLPEYTITGLGPTLNDASDVDAGPNYYMNFPVISSAVQNSTQLEVGFSLDAANSTVDGLYRVEFFVNDNPGITGYGQGQKYLGYINTTNGTGKQANLVLDAGTNLSGKLLSATTTALSSATASGFGSTSEFAQDLAVTVTTPALPPRGAKLASTANDTRAIIALLLYVLLLEALLITREAELMGGYKYPIKLAKQRASSKIKRS
jgi:CSLREA domain-containing protein